MNKLTHVAVIMDGNGRWAKKRGLLRLEGHKVGLDTAERVIEHCIARNIKYISLYVFSTENWKRPKAEIHALFSLAEKYLDDLSKFCRNRTKVVVSGEIETLPESLRKKIEKITSETQSFDAICVNLCINYGGKADIVQAARKLADSGAEITEATLDACLYNAQLPPPDLIIRTGGEKRLSNFLLYRAAYSELYFSDTLWPDFSIEEFDGIIDDFCRRTRNFGGLVDKQK